jgi:hypothetical protein
MKRISVFKFFENERILCCLIYLCLVYTAASQTCSIQKIFFSPYIPKPGDTLKLHCSIGSSGVQTIKIGIQLVVFADKNGNYRYDEPGEVTMFTKKDIEDNQPGIDEDTLRNEIEIDMFHVPFDHPPQKYIATVTCGKDNRSESIIVPLQQPCYCDSNEVSNPKLFYFVYCLFERYRNILEFMKRGSDQCGEDNHNGDHGLYVYNLKEKQISRLAYNVDLSYHTPKWSTDNKRIAFIVNQNNIHRVAWIDYLKRDFKPATDGPQDHDPFWLPDNVHILFLRENRLCIIDTGTSTTEIVAESVYPDHILGVTQRSEHIIDVFYEATSENKIKEIYMLELTNEYKKKDPPVHLVDARGWLLASNISSISNKFVFIKNCQLFIGEIGINNNAQKIFNDTFYYHEPSWSSDDENIVFVSNRK